jgi:hypothetical protein
MTSARANRAAPLRPITSLDDKGTNTSTTTRGGLSLTYESLDLTAGTGLTMAVYTAEPGSVKPTTAFPSPVVVGAIGSTATTGCRPPLRRLPWSSVPRR